MSKIKTYGIDELPTEAPDSDLIHVATNTREEIPQYAYGLSTPPLGDIPYLFRPEDEFGDLTTELLEPWPHRV